MTTMLPGDIVLYRSKSWLGGAIRFFSRVPEEPETKWNHVAVAVGDRHVVEALRTVECRPLETSVRGNVWQAWRYKGATTGQVSSVPTIAWQYVGKKYGHAKIAAHALDWGLSRIVGREVYAARRLCRMDNYPICSWVVTHVLDKAFGLRFGIDPDMAQPDDMGDWIESHVGDFDIIQEGQG